MSEQDTELLDTTNLDENELDNIEEDTEDVEALREQLERERTARQQLTARAKKAEAELKATKAQTAPPTQNTNNLTSLDIEAKILKAQRISDEDINYLKKIAAFNNTSLIDAVEDDMYSAYKLKKEAEEKSEKAKLGVSSRSGTVKQKQTVSSPGLSDSEHKALWREANGN